MENWILYTIFFFGGVILASLVFVALYFLRIKDKNEDPQEARRRLMRGTYQVLKENWSLALTEYSEVAKIDPGKHDIYFVLGFLYRKMGLYSRAIQVHRGIYLRHDLDNEDEDIKRMALFELSEDYLAANKNKIALEILEELSETSPGWVEPLEKLLTLEIKTEKWLESTKVLKKLEAAKKERQDSLAAHLYAQAAIIALNDGDTKKAKSLCKAGLVRNRHSAHIHLTYALFHTEKGKIKAAYKAIKEGVEAEPETALIMLSELYRICKSLNELDVFDEYLYERQEQAMPESFATRLFLAKRKADNGDIQQAQQTYKNLYTEGYHIPYLFEFAKKTDLDLDNETEDANWVCNNCGHELQTLDWYCPKCLSWKTYIKIDRKDETG